MKPRKLPFRSSLSSWKARLAEEMLLEGLGFDASLLMCVCVCVCVCTSFLVMCACEVLVTKDVPTLPFLSI